MTTAAPERIEVHPPISVYQNDPWYDEDDFDDDECTEGMTRDQCDELCTRLAKRQGICACKRKKREDD